MSRLEKLLGILLFLLLLLGGAIGFFFWQQSQIDQSLPGSGALDAPGRNETGGAQAGGINRAASMQSALLALGIAQGKIFESQPDALLLRGSATWQQFEEEGEVSSGEESWTFTFYSPEDQTTVTSSVVDGRPTFNNPKKQNAEIEVFDIGVWQINSTEAMRIFFENGGRDFVLSEPDPSITMTINLSAEEDRPHWLVAVISLQTAHSLTLWIDATSGEVYKSLQVP